MNREEAKQLLPIIQAFAEGEAIQWRRCTQGCWLETSHVDFPDFGLNHGAHCYRIKPKPILRPWKPEEAPKLFVARDKRSGHYMLIENGRDWHMELDITDWQALADNCVRIAEDGTEHPCGVIE